MVTWFSVCAALRVVHLFFSRWCCSLFGCYSSLRFIFGREPSSEHRSATVPMARDSKKIQVARVVKVFEKRCNWDCGAEYPTSCNLVSMTICGIRIKKEPHKNSKFPSKKIRSSTCRSTPAQNTYQMHLGIPQLQSLSFPFPISCHTWRHVLHI